MVYVMSSLRARVYTALCKAKRDRGLNNCELVMSYAAEQKTRSITLPYHKKRRSKNSYKRVGYRDALKYFWLIEALPSL